MTVYRPVDDPGLAGLYGELVEASAPCQACLKRFEEDRPLRLLRRSHLPARLGRWTFESYPKGDHAAPFEAALKFARGEAGFTWLVLFGGPGTAKTGLAVAVMNERLAHPEWGLPVGVYAKAPDFLEDLRRGFRDDSHDALMEAYRLADLLVLDDLGAEYRKRQDDGMSWADEQLYRLLDHRWEEARPTVVTMNRNPRHVEKRIRDRLLDTKGGFSAVFAFTRESQRSGVRW